MPAIILSGGPTGGNWLPLLLPIVAILLFLKGGEILVRFIKKIRPH